MTENCDFLKLAGFTVDLVMTETTGVLQSDKTMLKRIFNNLFSNILKYGDKRQIVRVSGQIRETEFIVSVLNSIKTQADQIDSTNIGLKSVDKMIHLLNGRMAVQQAEERFCVELGLPLQ